MGFDYLSAHKEEEFINNLDSFFSVEASNPVLFEVITTMEVNAEVFKSYYHKLKTI
jgi:2-succinyl-5-enolpyruvyl-6-hydroxy-3-cyclohexene-1-carboxylate synthase